MHNKTSPDAHSLSFQLSDLKISSRLFLRKTSQKVSRIGKALLIHPMRAGVACIIAQICKEKRFEKYGSPGFPYAQRVWFVLRC